MSKDKNAKAFAVSKHHRRRWLTFMRMFRYGVNNFTRNTWLTVAATVVMSLTLLIIIITVASQNILNDTINNLAKRTDRSIYLVAGTTIKQATPILDDIKNLPSVDGVEFVSSEQGRENYAKLNKSDPDTLNAITEATNMIPATIRVNLKNINDTKQLKDFVGKSEALKKYIDTTRPPSFMGTRGTALDTIAKAAVTIQEVGIGASVIFMALSMLIIFNTIRMAIFNRKDEIEMMKLIGAEKGFIRGPFVVEAMVYGFIASIISTGLGYLVIYSVQDKLTNWDIIVGPTISFYLNYMAIVFIAVVILGAIIGAVSSLLATRRYLKI